MNNDVIGIGGVFAFTLFLFLLRHFYLSIGRRDDKSRYVTPAAPRANKRSNSDSGADDAWLLWMPDLETETRVDDRQSQELRAGGEKKRTPVR